MTIPSRRWAVAWAALTAAFALHVVDEATHDFLAWYNPMALEIRARLGGAWFPPVFTFGIWISGLCVAIALLAALTPLLRERRPWLLVAAYIYAIVHVLNGIGHIAVSTSQGSLAPGTLSAPLLVAAASWLLLETERVRRGAGRRPGP